MTFKFIRRALFATAAVCTMGITASLAGCTIETNHPTAKITIEFNGESYEIEYKLYRNMYPQTVRHFIELADSGFYDNTVIHNYTSDFWYGGGYSYNAEDYAEDYAEATYFEAYSLEKTYDDLFNSGALTASVFKPGATVYDSTTALPTLIGEFSDNDHTIDNGALTSAFGVLRMYYTTKTSTAKVPVLTGQGQVLEHDYKYNSATSLFTIQTSDSASSLSSDTYCIFAVLKNDDATDTLNDLLDAIDDYIDDTYDDSSDFTSSVSGVNVDNYEKVSTDDQGQEVSYTTTAQPIIIKSVKITKY